MQPNYTIIGVDLSTESRGTGVVILRFGDERVEATLPPSGFKATDESLTRLVEPGCVVGLDSPLGWPREFVQAIGAHDAFDPWSDFGTSKPADCRRLLSQRYTDRFVKDKTGITPLSVSANLIGAVAMRAARLQTAWSTSWGGMQPRDGSGYLVEVYPAAALKGWGLPHQGYKGNAPPEVQSRNRGVILDRIVADTSQWLRINDEVRNNALRSDDVLDALIAALVALAAKSELTQLPPGEADRVRREGWIHLPTCALAELRTGSPISGG
jgi:predicted nuclease with RNAse H fold